MFPEPALVEEAAEASVRRRGKHLVLAQDVYEAWSDPYLAMHYDLLPVHRSDGRGKHFLGRRKPRQCRYCLRSRPETTFRHESHALPECLGNRSLISLDECDRCNEQFSHTFEDHLDKLTLPMRTMMGVPGKNGIPSFRSRDGKSRARMDPKERNLAIDTHEANPILTEDDGTKGIWLTLTCQPYIPFEVYRSLVKIAFAVLPTHQLGHFDRTRRWLLPALRQPKPPLSCMAASHVAFAPGRIAYPFIALWRRRRHDIPAPYMLCTLGACGILFMYGVPLSSLDRHLQPGRIIVPRFDLTVSAETVDACWLMLDLRSMNRETTTQHRYLLTFQES